MNKIFTICTLLLCQLGFSQIPDGYYDSADGLIGDDLREALMNIIDGHDTQTYSSLWTHFQVTDAKANDTVWDMYSDVPGGEADYYYTFVTDQCGNYGAEGDCYNREHSFPKSWFGGETPPMYTDLFHIVASDGYVNGQRGNYPYGEVDNASWTSSNGSKRGANTYPGYVGTVFEPIDEYKGDFARNYFYMLTRYKDLIDGWNSDMLDGDNFSDWAKNLLLDWSNNDTVSIKEIDRNNEIYGIQENRNPFIDHPEYIQAIWDLSASINEEKVIPATAFYKYSTIYLGDFEGKFDLVRLYSLSGAMIFESSLEGEKASFFINLTNGMYILDFNGESGRSSLKLVVSGGIK